MAVARKKMQEIQTQETKEDVTAKLYSTTYNLMAQEALGKVLEVLGKRRLFDVYFGQIPEIKDAKGFQEYLESLPAQEELEAILRKETIEEVKLMQNKITEIEEKRATALENPLIDYQLYLNDLSIRINSVPGFEINISRADYERVNQSEKGFNRYKVKLTKQIAKSLEDKFVKAHPSGFNAGDIVETTQLMEIDFDEGTFDPVYYHGGNETDVPLGSKGEVVDLGADDRLEVLFEIENTREVKETRDGGQKSGRKGVKKKKQARIGKDIGEETREKTYKTLQMHPDEITKIGVNNIKANIDAHGGDTLKLAEEIVDGIEAVLMPIHIEAKKTVINLGYNQEIEASTTALRKKYGINIEQILAIHKAEGDEALADFKYEVAGLEAITNARAPFYELGLLFYEALSIRVSNKQKDKIKRPHKAKIRGERALRKYVTEQAKTVTGKKAIKLAKTICDEVGALVAKQHYLKERELRLRNPNANVMQEMIKQLLHPENAAWTRRLIMYADRSLFKGGDPFAPPSEELSRVVKLETGNGCNYAKCTFCKEYAGADYFVRNPTEFKEHAEAVREKLGEDIRYIERVFLAGGNIFSLPTKRLKQYLNVVNGLFDRQPIQNGTGNNRGRRINGIRRIEAFSRTEGLLKKSVAEIRELVGMNLRLLYWGVETGSDEVLKYVNKGITRKDMDKAAKKVVDTRMMLSLMIMPGLGGIKYYEEHVQRTVEMINYLKPRWTTFHTVTPKHGTKYVANMKAEMEAGTNRPLTDEEVVEQMYDIVRGVTGEYRSLVATYYPPAAKIAINPIMFRGHLHRGEKRDIMSTIEYNYFGGEEHNPSLLIPEAKYNADSYLREHAHKRMEREQITQESLVGLEAAQKAQMLQEWMVQRKLQL